MVTKKVKQKVKRKNPWLDHVKEVKAQNKDLSFKDVLVKAKGTYKK